MNNGNSRIMKFSDIRSYLLSAYIVAAVPVAMLYMVSLCLRLLPKYSWTTLTLGDAALLIALVYYLLYIFYLHRVVDNYFISHILRKNEAVNVRGIRVILSEGAIRFRNTYVEILNAFVPTLLSIGPGGERIVVATRELRDRLSPEEFEAVVCHEEGHIVNMHTNTLYYLTPYVAIFAGAFSEIIYYVTYYKVFSPIEMGIFTFIVTLLAPLVITIFSAKTMYNFMEREADIYAVENCGEAFASALLKITRRKSAVLRLIDPHDAVERRVALSRRLSPPRVSIAKFFIFPSSILAFAYTSGFVEALIHSHGVAGSPVFMGIATVIVFISLLSIILAYNYLVWRVLTHFGYGAVNVRNSVLSFWGLGGLALPLLFAKGVPEFHGFALIVSIIASALSVVVSAYLLENKFSARALAIWALIYLVSSGVIALSLGLGLLLR